ncbi:MAG: hypothetical protein KKD38_04710 [Candidatus Delongbacteria bacterium]|nr:hypothetical protein [Candidatus Delongbacteria bacterium]MCG2761291.1 hypothetical protein [Candidatus Delongbacteria bacterium]
MKLIIISIFIAAMANIYATAINTMTVGGYPRDADPVPVSRGTGYPMIVFVSNVVVNNNSAGGWYITIDYVPTVGSDAFGVLYNSLSTGYQWMYFETDIEYVSGTLGTGLTLEAPPGTEMSWWVAAYEQRIRTLGTASTATVNYTFNIRVKIYDSYTTYVLAGLFSCYVTLTLISL